MPKACEYEGVYSGFCKHGAECVDSHAPEALQDLRKGETWRAFVEKQHDRLSKKLSDSLDIISAECALYGVDCKSEICVGLGSPECAAMAYTEMWGKDCWFRMYYCDKTWMRLLQKSRRTKR